MPMCLQYVLLAACGISAAMGGVPVVSLKVPPSLLHLGHAQVGLPAQGGLEALLLESSPSALCNTTHVKRLIDSLVNGELKAIRTDCFQRSRYSASCPAFKAAMAQQFSDWCKQATQALVELEEQPSASYDTWNIGREQVEVYQRLMEESAADDAVFDRFRRDQSSITIFEDPGLTEVTLQLVDHIQRRNPVTFSRADVAEVLRTGTGIGGPSPESLQTLNGGSFPPGGLSVAPVQVRYLSVAVDISLWFGRSLLDTPLDVGPGARVVEVGGGFGGQAHTCLSLFQGIGDWMIFDLPAVEQVQRKWLGRALAPEKASRVRLGNTELGGLAGLEERIARGEEPAEFDLFVSNYALSELKPHSRAPYVSSLIARSRRGQIAWNFPDVHWILEELEKLGKENVALYDERPYRAAANVVVSWGLPVFAKDGAPWSGWDPRAVH